jgi:hypothetical protein
VTDEVRKRCALDDTQVVALFKSVFDRAVPIERIAFSHMTIADLRGEYLDPLESVVILDEEVQGLPVLVIAHAMSKSRVVGNLLAIDYGDCRLFTVQ